jgi:hypothetical protein
MVVLTINIFRNLETTSRSTAAALSGDGFTAGSKLCLPFCRKMSLTSILAMVVFAFSFSNLLLATKFSKSRVIFYDGINHAPITYKIAVVVTGSFQRFIFQSTLQHVMQPLRTQGHTIDYYVSLSMYNAPAYRSELNYMNHLASDPIFDKCIYQEDNVTFHNNTFLKKRVHELIKEQVMNNGANLQYMTYQDNYAGIDTNERIQDRRNRAKHLYPHEDPDVRFPMMDIRNAGVMNRTANANRNMLNLFYHMQHVYQQLLAYEVRNRVKYDYVLFLRDDTMWLQNFDFRSLVHGNNASITSIDLFVPSCDARVPPLHPLEINDHIAVVKRDKADVYGFYFDELLNTDLDSCAQRLDDKLRYGRSILPTRGCNSEMILQFILEKNNVTIQKVGQGIIPFQRMAFVKLPNTSSVQSCFHKYCQSHLDPLTIPEGIVKCTELQM